MKPKEIIRELAGTNPDAMHADGFEDALIGTVERFGMGPVLLYDYDKCIEILVDRDGMTHEEAAEFFEFNTLGAFVGEGTPCFAKIQRIATLEAR